VLEQRASEPAAAPRRSYAEHANVADTNSRRVRVAESDPGELVPALGEEPQVRVEERRLEQRPYLSDRD
jgi:hypothetical protein